ncbi:MAG: hypothetical protein ABI238_02865 [Terrimesophilobacter sp.]
MTTFDFAGSSVLEMPGDRTVVSGSKARRGIRLVQLHEDLWRVTRVDGDVLGYVEGYDEPRGRRFRSKRLIPLQKRFVALGEFWSFDDAVDCLRFG